MEIVPVKNGTRGTRGGKAMMWAMKVLRRRLINSHRKQGDKFRGMDVLYLTAIGAKSGEPRTTALAYFRDGDGWLVIASAGGSARNPAWYYNIAKHPDRVTIEVGGTKIPVVAEQLTGERRAEVWAKVAGEHTGFAGYQAKTDREIPVIRLTRSPGS
ncbi:nitroreductase/quinone reductase family protein [Amycolatopsis magusensis]|uniref:Deazaflavin-dependent oxidoreductase (Nitroreductase family) n=1 Tax=Amycolatopsis magusensis TaxID=882444 RepID=A0ABS4PI49_9PSEU|nr:nitroreductase/quinone reductase family protein [Amycolatopsis magusensis]MBP2179101.1 deazaflavin-dependent oxidoreductase (nitroreductase family) [Amycolatopsis magusensis]MDI5977633.1 nitroreductase/quinone reductase family protein [Amycolatopsis magusensis]